MQQTSSSITYHTIIKTSLPTSQNTNETSSHNCSVSEKRTRTSENALCHAAIRFYACCVFFIQSSHLIKQGFCPVPSFYSIKEYSKTLHNESVISLDLSMKIASLPFVVFFYLLMFFCRDLTAFCLLKTFYCATYNHLKHFSCFADEETLWENIRLCIS